MATPLQETTNEAYQRLIKLLTAEDADLLAKALEMVRHTSGGWGRFDVTLKNGHIDGVEILSSIRKKKLLKKT